MGWDVHEGMRKPHFRPVDYPIAHSLDQSERIVVLWVEDYAFEGRLYALPEVRFFY